MGLLRWLGFVKLADYGLELTRDHRIRIPGWTVLDDGKGGAIVGWTDSDAAIFELKKWQLVKPQNATSKPHDDDEWDWMIATARARADAPRVRPARVEPARVEPARVEPARVEPARVEPARVEPARVEPARVEPARMEPARVEPARVEPARVEPARVEPEATFDDQPTQARIADELPTKTWLDGNTEIDPPRARMARGTPSPESVRRSNAKREDPWRHDVTVPAPLVTKPCEK